VVVVMTSAGQNTSLEALGDPKNSKTVMFAIPRG
jgi:hypothetical protein